MKILFVTNMLPVPDFIYFGIHVKEQIDTIGKMENIEKTVYFINGRHSKLNYLKSIIGIYNLLKKDDFDLIHIHYGLSTIFLLFFKPIIPVIVTLHSGELFQKQHFINHLIQKNITIAALKNVEKIIVLNDAMIALLKRYHNKLLKLPCGIDLSYFKEQPVSRYLKKFTIGFPGNKARNEKNYSLFVEIINSLRICYDIEVIEFHNLTREEVLLNLNKIDLLLMTSLVEGSPQIIKEAMACNRPIVSTSVGDVADLLNKVHNCYVVNSFRTADFHAPIRELINLPAEKRKSNGRNRLLELGLDAESVANTLFTIYQEMV